MSRAVDRSVLELLRTRRSPKLRSLAAPGPGDDELAEILTVASRVPDHGKLVPWRFIVIRGDRRHELGAVIGDCFNADNPAADENLRSEARNRLTHAPLIVAVVSCPRPHPKVPEWEQFLSAGAVCMNMLIAARATGYAAVWLTEWYATDRRVLSELNVGDSERIVGFIHIGTELGTRDDRARPDLAEIVTEY